MKANCASRSVMSLAAAFPLLIHKEEEQICKNTNKIEKNKRNALPSSKLKQPCFLKCKKKNSFS